MKTNDPNQPLEINDPLIEGSIVVSENFLLCVSGTFPTRSRSGQSFALGKKCKRRSTRPKKMPHVAPVCRWNSPVQAKGFFFSNSPILTLEMDSATSN